MGVLPVHRSVPAARRTVDVVDNRVEVREFLTSRRAKISPERAGLPAAGQRRVPGLRRSEVAALAGMSVEYYAKLERGSLAGVSAGVLDALARALQLDDAERAHLLRLAHEADGSNAILRPRRRPKQWTVRPSLQWSLDAITPPRRSSATTGWTCSPPTTSAGPCTATSTPTPPAHRTSPGTRSSTVRPAGSTPTGTWPPTCAVANLRTAAGKDPHDKGLHDLVGELSTRSDDFRRRWGAHNVRTHGTGVKHFRHHIVGDLTLAYESLDLRAEPDLTLTIYTAEPDSPTAHALALLASWAPTEHADTAAQHS